MSTTFLVDDMTCGHCVSTITKAIASLDKEAQVNVDLGTRQVEVASLQAGKAELQQAIRDAGFTPVLVQANPAAATQPKGSGCGCGCG